MQDIKKCQKCKVHHMDVGESCKVCGANLCADCALREGFWFFDIFEGAVFVCKDCITVYKDKGMDWLRGELCEEFEEKVFLAALNEFEARGSRTTIFLIQKTSKQGSDLKNGRFLDCV